VPLPDAGSSTPVIWGERIFLTQAVEKHPWPASNSQPAASKRLLMCLHRADGKLLWKRDIACEPETTNPGNPFCSASPVTDGERVIVSYGSAGLYCYDFDGELQWHVAVPKLRHTWGNASSPILYGDLVIYWCAPSANSYLFAFDKRTGKKVWEHHVPNAKGTSWVTPLVIQVQGRDQLLLPIAQQLKSFDPRTGKELWYCDGLGPLVYPSPLYAGGVVVALSGYHGPGLAVRIPSADAAGDLTAHRLWVQQRGQPQRVGSGVIVGEHFYILEENGVAHGYELTTGKEVWFAQTKMRASAAKSWSSMVHADGKLFVLNEQGDTLVFAASPKYELLAVNRLFAEGESERTDASLALSDGEWFIRTWKHLWCISSKR
jgi:outer membrane protein assembly factor BamB